VSLVRLATAGFLYTGDSDGVVCSHCDQVVRGWTAGARSPLAEHRCTARHADAADQQFDIRAPPADAPSSAGRSRQTKEVQHLFIDRVK